MKKIIFTTILIPIIFLACNKKKQEKKGDTGQDTTVALTPFQKACKHNNVLKTIAERRSIRIFKDQDISDDTLKLLIKAAQWAPSASNTQTWRFIVVRDTATRMKIAREVHRIFNKEREKKAPFDKIKKYLGVDAPIQVFVFNDTRGFIDEVSKKSNAIGCYAAIQNFLLAAKSMEIGTCWQAFQLLAKDNIYELLEVPKGLELVSTIAVGYPGENPEPPKRKHQLKEILKFEKWE